MRQYFYIQNNQQLGPFTKEQLLQAGIQGHTMVWTEGLNAWQPARRLPEFTPYFGQAAFDPRYDLHPAFYKPKRKNRTIVYCVMLGLALLTCIVGSVFAWLETESIVATGPIASAFGIAAFILAWHLPVVDKVISLIPFGLSVFVTVAINVFSWNPREAQEPVTMISGVVSLVLLGLVISRFVYHSKELKRNEMDFYP